MCVCLSFYGFMADEGGNRKGQREEVCVSGFTLRIAKNVKAERGNQRRNI